LNGLGAVLDHQVAAGRDGGHQAVDDRPRPLVLGERAEHTEQHHGHWPAEVQGPGGGAQDALGVARVGLEVLADTFRGAGQQRLRVDEHQRVVVHVNDLALRRDPLRDLVGVVMGGQPGADVKELPDPGLPGQEPDGTPKEHPREPRHLVEAGVRLKDLLRELAVGRIVVRASDEVVPHPRLMRHGRVDRNRRLVHGDSLRLDR
jgi:hypothetical protein